MKWTMHWPNHGKVVKLLAGLVSNMLCMIRLKHLSANMTRNTKNGYTQMTRYYVIYWPKGTKNPPKSGADQKHQIHGQSIQRPLQNNTEIHTSTEVWMFRNEGGWTTESRWQEQYEGLSQWIKGSVSWNNLYI